MSILSNLRHGDHFSAPKWHYLQVLYLVVTCQCCPVERFLGHSLYVSFQRAAAIVVNIIRSCGERSKNVCIWNGKIIGSPNYTLEMKRINVLGFSPASLWPYLSSSITRDWKSFSSSFWDDNTLHLILAGKQICLQMWSQWCHLEGTYSVYWTDLWNVK